MRITVFTPTYNRAYTLTRLYDSLKQQTYRDFEWVIVDDGSTDDTTTVINRFVEEKPFFPIIYKKTENGGKHRAINRGMQYVSGELMLLMDSDDWLREDALEWIDRIEKTIPANERSHFAGIQGLCAHTDREIIGKTFEGEVLDTTTIERGKYNISGDKCEVYYANVMRRYPFPEFEGEKFLTEGLVWDKMAADGLKIRYFNEAIYFCEYLEDGLTHGGNMLYARNPKQWGLFIHRNYTYGKEDLFHTMLKVYTYYLFEKSIGMKLPEMARNLRFSVPFVSVSIATQYISDILRWVLHNKITVRASVEKEKAEAAAQAQSPRGGGIPKVIHYCWFGQSKKPESVLEYIESWKRLMPDYTIKEWNEDNFDVAGCPYVEEAYKAKKYAFVSDYARLIALYREGGFYLDTDIETVRSFDTLLKFQAVAGFEEREYVMTGFLGAVKGNAIILDWLKEYSGRHFLKADGSYDTSTNVHLFTGILEKHGLIRNGNWQTVDGVELFPMEYFSPKNYYTEKIRTTASTYTIHHFSRSWSEGESVKNRILRKHRFLNKLYFFPHVAGKRILGERYDVLKRRIKG